MSWLVQVEVACCYSLLGLGSGSVVYAGAWVSKIHLKEFSKSIGATFFSPFKLAVGTSLFILFLREILGVVGSSGAVTWKSWICHIPLSRSALTSSGRALKADVGRSICHSRGWMASSAAMGLSGCSCRCPVCVAWMISWGLLENLPHDKGCLGKGIFES